MKHCTDSAQRIDSWEGEDWVGGDACRNALALKKVCMLFCLESLSFVITSFQEARHSHLLSVMLVRESTLLKPEPQSQGEGLRVRRSLDTRHRFR